MAFKQLVKVVEAAALAAALVFVIMLFANEGGSDSTGGTPSVGATIYSSTCAGCHGSDGGGGLGPKLVGAVTKDFPDIEDQIAFVSEGKGVMPAFGPGGSRELSEEDLRAVVEYTRTDLGG